jgi:hypothetical protein
VGVRPSCEERVSDCHNVVMGIENQALRLGEVNHLFLEGETWSGHDWVENASDGPGHPDSAGEESDGGVVNETLNAEVNDGDEGSDFAYWVDLGSPSLVEAA